MLTYDAVLRTQERLSENASTINEAETAVKSKSAGDMIKTGFVKVVQFIRTAMIQLGQALLTMIDQGKKIVAQLAKLGTKNIRLDGMTIMGYPFSGLNNRFVAKYKNAKLDIVLKQLGIPVFNTLDDVRSWIDSNKKGETFDFMKEEEPERFKRVCNLMTGITPNGNNIKEIQNDLMLTLWGSAKGIILTGEKDFTMSDTIERLVNPPIARSLIFMYSELHKKLDGYRANILDKKNNKVRQANKLAREAETRYAHSDEMARRVGLNKEEQERMEHDLGSEYIVITNYAKVLSNLAKAIHTVNQCIIGAVKAQNHQCRFIIRKAIRYKTPEEKAKKDAEKAANDPMHQRDEKAKQYKTSERSEDS